MAMKIILLILILVLWVLEMIAGGLTSQYATKLVDIENPNSTFWCHNSHRSAIGGAVFHWLGWLCLVRSCVCVTYEFHNMRYRDSNPFEHI